MSTSQTSTQALKRSPCVSLLYEISQALTQQHTCFAQAQAFSREDLEGQQKRWAGGTLRMASLGDSDEKYLMALLRKIASQLLAMKEPLLQYLGVFPDKACLLFHYYASLIGLITSDSGPFPYSILEEAGLVPVCVDFIYQMVRVPHPKDDLPPMQMALLSLYAVMSKGQQDDKPVPKPSSKQPSLFKLAHGAFILAKHLATLVDPGVDPSGMASLCLAATNHLLREEQSRYHSEALSLYWKTLEFLALHYTKMNEPKKAIQALLGVFDHLPEQMTKATQDSVDSLLKRLCHSLCNSPVDLHPILKETSSLAARATILERLVSLLIATKTEKGRTSASCLLSILFSPKKASPHVMTPSNLTLLGRLGFSAMSLWTPSSVDLFRSHTTGLLSRIQDVTKPSAFDPCLEACFHLQLAYWQHCGKMTYLGSLRKALTLLCGDDHHHPIPCCKVDPSLLRPGLRLGYYLALLAGSLNEALQFLALLLPSQGPPDETDTISQGILETTGELGLDISGWLQQHQLDAHSDLLSRPPSPSTFHLTLSRAYHRLLSGETEAAILLLETARQTVLSLRTTLTSKQDVLALVLFCLCQSILKQRQGDLVTALYDALHGLALAESILSLLKDPTDMTIADSNHAALLAARAEGTASSFRVLHWDLLILVVRLLHWIGQCYTRFGSHRDALYHHTQGVQLIQASEGSLGSKWSHYGTLCSTGLAELHLLMGHLDEADQLLASRPLTNRPLTNRPALDEEQHDPFVSGHLRFLLTLQRSELQKRRHALQTALALLDTKTSPCTLYAQSLVRHWHAVQMNRKASLSSGKEHDPLSLPDLQLPSLYSADEVALYILQQASVLFSMDRLDATSSFHSVLYVNGSTVPRSSLTPSHPASLHRQEQLGAFLALVRDQLPPKASSISPHLLCGVYQCILDCLCELPSPKPNDLLLTLERKLGIAFKRERRLQFRKYLQTKTHPPSSLDAFLEDVVVTPQPTSLPNTTTIAHSSLLSWYRQEDTLDVSSLGPLLPASTRIVTLSLDSTHSCLLLSHIGGGRNQPGDGPSRPVTIGTKTSTKTSTDASTDASTNATFFLRIPITRYHERGHTASTLSYAQAKGEFDTILQLNRTSSTWDKTRSRTELSPDERRAWWDTRESLDRRLGRLLGDMEKVWFGIFKYALLPTTTTIGGDLEPAHLEKVREKLLKLFTRFDRTVQWDGPLDPFCVSCLCRAYRDPSCKTLLLADWLDWVLSGAPGTKGDPKKLMRDLESILHQTLPLQNPFVQAEGRPVQAREDHLILVLDSSLSAFPLESLPILQDRSVSRAPCLALCYELLCRLSLQRGPGLGPPERTDAAWPMDPVDGCLYLLNPGGDLTATQNLFEGPLTTHSSPLWKGFVGSSPPMDLSQELENYALYLYFGHGTGEQFVKPSILVRKLKGFPLDPAVKSAPVSFLMGCSSGALPRLGDFEPGGVPYDYLMANSPSVVANLWDVTDKDIDRFSMIALRQWGLLKAEEHVHPDSPETGALNEALGSLSLSAPSMKMHLSQAVASSRPACVLRYLVGAAPVVYGLPVRLVSRHEETIPKGRQARGVS